MAKIIGVRFRNNGKMYYFDSGRYIIKEGTGVIVETSQGVEFAEVIQGTREAAESEIVAPLKGIMRIATQRDIQQAQQNHQKEQEALEIATQKITEHELDMKLVRVEYTFDGAKIIFYFTSDGRVDFRDLVKDLASAFKTRIELRQIGARDEVKMLGGLGPCGLPCCCNQFLPDFQPVSIKMAKEQGLSLNPTKISGLCGRLMCCLKYEQSHYEQTRKLLPKLGSDVRCRDGVGKVCELNMLRERVKVKFTLPDDTIDIREYYYKELTPLSGNTHPEPEPELELEEELEEEFFHAMEVLPGESFKRLNELKPAAEAQERVKKQKNKPHRSDEKKDEQKKDGKKADTRKKPEKKDPDPKREGEPDEGKPSVEQHKKPRNKKRYKHNKGQNRSPAGEADGSTDESAKRDTRSGNKTTKPKERPERPEAEGEAPASSAPPRNKKRFNKRRFHKPAPKSEGQN